MYQAGLSGAVLAIFLLKTDWPGGRKYELRINENSGLEGEWKFCHSSVSSRQMCHCTRYRATVIHLARRVKKNLPDTEYQITLRLYSEFEQFGARLLVRRRYEQC